MLTEVVFRGRKLYFVDGSCISWTEVVFRGRKMYSVEGSCIPWTEVVDQLTWKEIKFVWFNKNNNLKSLPELLKMQVESRSRNVHFNTRCDHAEGVPESAILLSHAFAFVFSWYKVIVALSLCLSWGVFQHTVCSSIIAAKIVSLYYFFEPQYFGPDLRLARTKTAISIRSIQNADCRPGTKCRLNKKCRLRIFTFFFVWYVMACYRASRNRFSAIIFHDYLHYNCTVARFLVTIILNIISSLHIVFSLCARVGWCDVCTEFTNLIKEDVDINEMPLSNI